MGSDDRKRCYHCHRRGLFGDECTTEVADFLPRCGICSKFSKRCPILVFEVASSDSEGDALEATAF